MSVREIIRANPWKALIGSVSVSTIIFTLVGTVFSEMRYATVSDFEKQKVEIRELQKQLTELSKKQDK